MDKLANGNLLILPYIDESLAEQFRTVKLTSGCIENGRNHVYGKINAP